MFVLGDFFPQLAYFTAEAVGDQQAVFAKEYEEYEEYEGGGNVFVFYNVPGCAEELFHGGVFDVWVGLFDSDALPVTDAVGTEVVEFFQFADCGAVLGGDGGECFATTDFVVG